jgi:Flp pilus assembly protein TadG
LEVKAARLPDDASKMRTWTNLIGPNRRWRGVAMIYTVFAIIIMLGFCSFSVDLGRVQTVKTQLRRAADAAARAAAANLTGGTTATKTAASATAALNIADGKPVTIVTSTDVQFLNWTSKSNFTVLPSSTGANAVRVYCRRTKALGTAVPLLFGAVIGMPSCDVTAYSTAMIQTQTVTQYVSAISNPWLAGEPTGTQASEPSSQWVNSGSTPPHPWGYDIAGPTGAKAASGEPYGSPVSVGITVKPGWTIAFTNVSGMTSNVNTDTPAYTADGNGGTTFSIEHDATADGVSEHGIADVNTPINSLVAMFLDSGAPDTEGSAPAGLDFTSQSARDYAALSPLTRQPFYAGLGQTSGGVQQSVVVPAGATRLFLATMDGHEWSNNQGGFTATITETHISLVQ